MDAAAAVDTPLPSARPIPAPARPSRRERRLARRLARRHRDAIAEVQAEYGRVVLGYLVDRLGDRGTAEDVYQQVLLQVWERGDTYDPARASLLGWLLMIARSRATDAQRKRMATPMDPLEASEPASASQQDELLERWRIAHLLGRIPPEEARVLHLRFYDELSQSEIAARTGMALGTVKLRMVQGLDRLRALLDEDGDVP